LDIIPALPKFNCSSVIPEWSAVMPRSKT